MLCTHQRRRLAEDRIVAGRPSDARAAAAVAPEQLPERADE
jgi:hypothetical protein